VEPAFGRLAVRVLEDPDLVEVALVGIGDRIGNGPPLATERELLERAAPAAWAIAQSRFVDRRFLGTAETDEYDLPKFGDAAVGLTTAFHYSAAHPSAANQKFIAALKARDANAVVNYAVVGAWDGMHVIHKMIEATGGQRDGVKAIAAVRGLQWESPRGPVRIDPKTRHIVQNVYLRQVQKRGNELVNVELQNFGPQIDWGLDK